MRRRWCNWYVVVVVQLNRHQLAILLRLRVFCGLKNSAHSRSNFIHLLTWSFELFRNYTINKFKIFTDLPLTDGWVDTIEGLNFYILDLINYLIEFSLLWNILSKLEFSWFCLNFEVINRFLWVLSILFCANRSFIFYLLVAYGETFFKRGALSPVNRAKTGFSYDRYFFTYEPCFTIMSLIV